MLGKNTMCQLPMLLRVLLEEKLLDIEIILIYVRRYILDRPCVAGVIIGCRLGITDHISDSLKVFSFTLSQEDMDAISNVAKKGKMLPGDCGDEYR